MKTFVELETFRKDGKLAICRVPCVSLAEAKEFQKVYWDDFTVDRSELFKNDFGETVLISIKQYGDNSQVKAGVLVL